MRTGLIFSLILAVLAVIFALANPGTMEVDFVFFRTSGSTALILLLTFGFGVLVGLLSTLPRLLRNQRKLTRLQKKQGSAGDAGSSFTPPKSSSSPSRTEDNS